MSRSRSLRSLAHSHHYLPGLSQALLGCLAAALALTVPACKKTESTSKAAGDPAATPKAAEAAAVATDVAFKTFATELMTVDDLQKIYPAGKRFALAAVLKSAPDCSQSGECRIELSDGGKTYKTFSIDLANKPKLDGKAAGAAISLDCVPVYEQGAYDTKPALQFDKSCNVR